MSAVIKQSIDQVFGDGSDSTSSEGSPPFALGSTEREGVAKAVVRPMLVRSESMMTPKRKSLLEQIDEDHPGSRSAMARTCRLVPPPLAPYSLFGLEKGAPAAAAAAMVPRPPMLRAKSAPRVNYSAFFTDDDSPEEDDEDLLEATAPALDLNDDLPEGTANDLSWRWLRETQEAASVALKRGSSGVWTPELMAAAAEEIPGYPSASAATRRAVGAPETSASPAATRMRTRQKARRDGSPPAVVHFKPQLAHEELQPLPAASVQETAAPSGGYTGAQQHAPLVQQQLMQQQMQHMTPEMQMQMQLGAVHMPMPMGWVQVPMPMQQQMQQMTPEMEMQMKMQPMQYPMRAMAMQHVLVPASHTATGMQAPYVQQLPGGYMQPMMIPAQSGWFGAPQHMAGAMSSPHSQPGSAVLSPWSEAGACAVPDVPSWQQQQQPTDWQGGVGSVVGVGGSAAAPAASASGSARERNGSDGGGGGGGNGSAAESSSRGSSKVTFGQLAALAMDPKGSRLLQAEMPRMSRTQFGRARAELGPHLYGLAKHTFGNYLVSRLATIEAMHETLAAAFRGHMLELMCHAQGSRVVQAFLQALPAGAALGCVAELGGSVLECALDTHGSWGICVAFEHTRAPFVLHEIASSVYELSIQQHGCRVVQSVMQAAAKADMDLRPAVEGIIGSGVMALASHRFANYAVQVALREGSAEHRELMLSTLLPQLLKLSANKHGSNVAEVVLASASADQVASVTDAVLANPSDLAQLMGDSFGNYVLQTLLRRIDEPERRAAALAKVRAATTASNYGRSILSRLEGEAA